MPLFANSNSNVNIRQGWFTETETLWPGQKFALALERFSESSIRYNQKSDFQDVLVFQSAQYGHVLCLDGVIQVTERDEFAYHETLVHIPLCAHPNPRRVLVVGGGDGFALRELCKYSTVQEIVLVEIDPVVVQVAQQFFASVQSYFADPRVRLVHQDAATYLQQLPANECFDVILSDSSDPVGPAESLFQPLFYEHLYRALRPQGVLCAQAECFWIHLDLISDLVACCQEMGFGCVEYATTLVPTYPCGQIGFVLAQKAPRSSRFPIREAPGPNLKWYNRDMHQAAFVLPTFVQERLYGRRNPTALNGLPTERIDDGCCLGGSWMKSLVAAIGFGKTNRVVLESVEER